MPKLSIVMYRDKMDYEAVVPTTRYSVDIDNLLTSEMEVIFVGTFVI